MATMGYRGMEMTHSRHDKALTALKVGVAQTEAFGWSGQIAEVIGCNRALTQAEVETVLTHLGTRYAIAIGA
jgi:hypothetical protein